MLFSFLLILLQGLVLAGLVSLSTAPLPTVALRLRGGPHWVSRMLLTEQHILSRPFQNTATQQPQRLVSHTKLISLEPISVTACKRRQSKSETR
ncbi:hypothetical protein V8C86DRAFT_1366592 [Haematococcus lacustris]